MRARKVFHTLKQTQRDFAMSVLKFYLSINTENAK